MIQHSHKYQGVWIIIDEYEDGTTIVKTLPQDGYHCKPLNGWSVKAEKLAVTSGN